MSSRHRSGLVTLIGRPNVGKSTLLNRLVGGKISITSPRPQTTRHRILGIKTGDHAQIVYIDTPGLQTEGAKRINRHMGRVSRGSVEGVDCIVLIITAHGWRLEDKVVLSLVRDQPCPVILAINKIDKLKDKSKLLPLIEQSMKKMDFAAVIPISAKTGVNLDGLENAIYAHLPEQPPIYPPDHLTDRSERFLAAELVREQVFRGFGQEIPYAAAVAVEQFQRTKDLVRINATIWVEKEGQKAILIGKQGARLKLIGQRARSAMQELFGSKVHLELWVKVRKGWSDNARALHSLGYSEED